MASLVALEGLGLFAIRGLWRSPVPTGEAGLGGVDTGMATEAGVGWR